MQFVHTLMVIIAAAAPAHAQAPAQKPLVESAPAIGWGDYAWLLPLVVLFVAIAGWLILRRRRAGL